MISIKVKFRKSTVAHKRGTVYYQLSENGACKQITAPYRIFTQEWDPSNSLLSIQQAEYPRREKLHQIENAIIRDVSNLLKMIDAGESIESCVRKFQKRKDENRFSLYGYAVADILKSEGRSRTANAYRSSIRSFMNFRNNRDIFVGDITPAIIKSYEKELKSKQISNNSISFYMRNLRAIYNRAVEDNYTEQKYPFKGVYTGIDKTAKRAVDAKVITRLKALDLTRKSSLARSRDLFMFSFYARGMAFVDIAHLKQQNIKGEHLVYQRQKTGQKLTIRMEPCLSSIVNKYATICRDGYLLPVFSYGSNNYDSALRLYNLHLKEISKLLGLSVSISSYVVRHSWATLAKRKGVPTQIISESMGHNNERTTQIYLSTLDQSTLDQANARLLATI